MKLLTNKNFTQKIIIALVFVILFNFVSPQISFGGIGGPLFEPIKDLTLTIADGIVNIIQSVIFGTDVSILKLEHDDSVWATVAAIGSGILTTVGIIAAWIAVPFTAGLSIGVFVTALALGGGAAYAVGQVVSSMIPQTYYLPLYNISPEEIFSNDVALLDVNFFNPGKSTDFNSGNMLQSGKEQISSAAQLQATISQWYFTIRNFAIVALLSILVYIGIRIVISSSAQDKAKYKQRLLDWLVAMCLLFFLHYIMAFAVTITELITESLNGVNKDYIQILGTDEYLDGYHWNFSVTKDDGEKVDITDGLWSEDSEMFKTLHDNSFIVDGRIKDDGSTTDDGYTLAWPTNLMGKARIEACLIVDGEYGDNTLIRQFGYTIIFLALVIYTVLFLFRYLKRLLMLAFLTIIAPFVAMTYPLDKISDGSAQAFNMWLKEYIYNLLIQPVHLILYSILIGSAMNFATNNLLYALAALGFMLQAEKIMRKFFGFEKATTLEGGSALGGALAMQGINMLRKIGGPKKGKGGAGGKGEKGSGNEDSKVRFANNRKANKGKGVNDLLENGGKDDGGKDDGGNPPILPNPYNPLDHTSEEGNRIKDAKAMYKAGLIDKDEWKRVKETDTRGLGQAMHDRYQGSGLQKRIHDIANNKKVRSVGKFLSSPIRYPIKAAKGIYKGGGKLVRKVVPKPIRNTIRGATSVVGKGLGAVGKAAIHAAPGVAKLALKGTVAGAAAMGGIAAGLVSDEYGNVGKWGAAGAGAGWVGASGALSLGENVVNKASDAVEGGIEAAASTYTIAAHGREAEEERQKRIADKRAMQDKERRKLYADKLKLDKKEDLEEAMRQAQTYRESGITDDELIIKAMKAKTFESELDSEERIIAAGLAAKVGEDTKKMEYVKKELEKKGISKEDIETYEKAIKEINEWTI